MTAAHDQTAHDHAVHDHAVHDHAAHDHAAHDQAANGHARAAAEVFLGLRAEEQAREAQEAVRAALDARAPAATAG